MDSILALILKEREYGFKKYGTEFDDKNTHEDWKAYIIQYLGMASQYFSAGLKTWDEATDNFYKKMVKVAALAVAALEWDRRLDQRSADAQTVLSEIVMGKRIKPLTINQWVEKIGCSATALPGFVPSMREVVRLSVQAIYAAKEDELKLRHYDKEKD